MSVINDAAMKLRAVVTRLTWLYVEVDKGGKVVMV
jgi:hypothetical protein